LRLVRQLEDHLEELCYQRPALNLAGLAGMLPPTLVESIPIEIVGLQSKKLVRQHFEVVDERQQHKTRLRFRAKGGLNGICDELKRAFHALLQLLAGAIPVHRLPHLESLELEKVYPTLPLHGLDPIKHGRVCVLTWSPGREGRFQD
jgi:hypothetical protein